MARAKTAIASTGAAERALRLASAPAAAPVTGSARGALGRNRAKEPHVTHHLLYSVKDRLSVLCS